MIIRHIGHAEFYIETESGYRLVIDPYDDTCGYPVCHLEADAVLVSHSHHDHNAVEVLQGSPAVIDRAGVHTPAPGIRVTAVRGFHDDVSGTKRGETLMFLIEAEGLRVVHLGDIGCRISDEQNRILHEPDVLMIPVGGFYTIDGKAAAETAETLNARIVMPMHYKTQYNPDWPISGPEVFLGATGRKQVLRDAEAIRISSGDKDEQQYNVVLFRQ